MQADSHFHPDGAWFVRKGTSVRGLFPFGAIMQDLRLGRLDLFAEISKDGERWTPLGAHPDLLPQSMLRERIANASDWASERLCAGMRWADERSGRDRRAFASPQKVADRRDVSDRRRDPAQCARPKVDDARGARRHPRDTLVASVLGVVLLLGILAIFASGFANPIPVRLHLPGVTSQSD